MSGKRTVAIDCDSVFRCHSLGGNFDIGLLEYCPNFFGSDLNLQMTRNHQCNIILFVKNSCEDWFLEFV